MMNEIIKMVNNLGWHAEVLTDTDIIIFDKVNPECPKYCIPVTVKYNDMYQKVVAARTILAEEFYKVLVFSAGKEIGLRALEMDDITDIGNIRNHDLYIWEFENGFKNFVEEIKKEA